MFTEARIKLTAWYLAIIMVISLSFSGVIYLGVNRELSRIANFQRVRIQGIARGYPTPMEVPFGPDTDAINEARVRIITTLGIINLSILILSGLGGYFLAGVTLEPISKMLEDQKNFVSNASHELRTPLTSLMTEIEVALRDKKMGLADSKKLLESNLEEVKKMNSLSNYLLQLNRFQDGGANLEIKKIDLKVVTEKVISKIAPIAKAKRIKLISNLDKSIVKGNEESVKELVTILLDNAIKYSLKNTSVNITVRTNGTLKISDQGVGVSSKDMPHIFDRFYRSESSRNKEKSDGYGLGLSIAKSIVDLHGATIRVDSKLQKGTTFTVYF